ncbi:unnamed protein product [Coregonus sp. 'balchen']|nr:unnamed protein product [Coregonus sp. 'balchen']
MEEDSALVSYFDDPIGNVPDASGYLFEGDLGLQAPTQLQDTSFLSSLSQPEKNVREDLDLRFLPDDLPEETSGNAASNANVTQNSGVFNGYRQEESAETDPKMVAMLGASTFCPMTPVAESSGIIPMLQNIVSTVNLACPLDLKSIALQARNAEYNPKVFNEEQSRLAARKYARVVQKLGFPAKFLDFKIQNMVGSCDVCFPIRLEGAKERGEIYEAFENIYPILKGFRKQ